MTRAGRPRLARFGAALLVASLLALTGLAGSASAELPESLWQAPEDQLGGDSGGRLGNPRGLATDASSGRVYVADSFNSRIAELTPWGGFVKTWGWGVVASGPGDDPRNERQTVSVDATGGSFQLRYHESCCLFDTVSIAHNASAAVLQDALEDLKTFDFIEGAVPFGPDGVAVSGPSGGPWTIEFTGRLADTDMRQLEGLGASLTGGAATVTVATSQPGANYEVCVPADGDVCRSGQRGHQESPTFSAPGQLNGPQGLAVDHSHAVWVYEQGLRRAQKFSPSGDFLLMIGGEVNKTESEEPGSTEAERNLCTSADLEAGDTCGPGTAGTGKGQFSTQNAGANLAVGPDDTVYVGDKNRIQKFNSNGAYTGEIPLPEAGTVGALAVGPSSGDVYFAFPQGFTESEKDPHVYRLDPNTGAVLGSIEVPVPSALATDSAENLYVVINGGNLNNAPAAEILKFTAGGVCSICPGDGFVKSPHNPGQANPLLNGIATNTVGDVLVSSHLSGSTDLSYVTAYGPSPIDFEPPPAVAPTIAAQFAVSVEPKGATVKAEVNPRFWPDTRYYVQYGAAPCSEGGCAEQPLPPGAKLAAKSVNRPLTTAGVFIDGLQPTTTYHYRFVAESGGGGPTFGSDRSFKTPPLPVPSSTQCPNQAFRSGLSSLLPDCRAYEMVTPTSAEGGEVTLIPDGLRQSALDGGGLVYLSKTGFGDAASSNGNNHYLASRGATGWSSHAINPPRGEHILDGGHAIKAEFKAFSEDLSESWLFSDSDPILAPGGVEGFANLYRQDSVGGGYEALTPAEPTQRSPTEYRPELQGVSADGAYAVFRVNDSLTPEAPILASEATTQLYGVREGQLTLLSILPSGLPSKSSSSAGTANSFSDFAEDSVDHALSDDGSRVFWTATSGLTNAGKIYLRFVDGEETIAVSQTVSADPAQFWTASPDGSRAIFTFVAGPHAGELYRFDVETQQSTLIADGVLSVAGASEDASRVYFVSTEVLASGASAGEPNLYLDDGEASEFIATLSNADSAKVAAYPTTRATRVSPDGRQIAFMSDRSLTGYENLDVDSGRPDAEVYRYNAESGELACVSCDPTGARPVGRALVDQEGKARDVAARIPNWVTQFYATRALSEDGSRLFFESFGPLVPGDTNGKADVYQWEEDGSGDCTAAQTYFVAESGGCLSLISSGKATQDAEFIDASASGDDVFFATSAALAPQDSGLADIYDARVNGGFAPPAAVPAGCEGDACQPPIVPLVDPTPASAAFQGAGDVAPAKKKQAKKHRKAKKHQKAKKRHRHGQAGHQGRTGR